MLGRPEIFKGLLKRRQKSDGIDVLKDIEFPLWISVVGIPFFSFLGAWATHAFFGVPWLLAFIAVGGFLVSIALYNENRRLIRELYAFRAERPWQASCRRPNSLTVTNRVPGQVVARRRQLGMDAPRLAFAVSCFSRLPAAHSPADGALPTPSCGTVATGVGRKVSH